MFGFFLNKSFFPLIIFQNDTAFALKAQRYLLNKTAVSSGFFLSERRLSRIIHLDSTYISFLNTALWKKTSSQYSNKILDTEVLSISYNMYDKACCYSFSYDFLLYNILPSPIPWLIAFNNYIHITCVSTIAFLSCLHSPLFYTKKTKARI